MNAESIAEQLAQYKSNNVLVEIHRDELDPHKAEGFIVALSSSLCMVQHFDNFFCDGYRAYRLKDITSIKSGEVEAFFTRRAIALGYAKAGGTPPPFHIPLDSWPELLNRLQREKLHVALHGEIEYPEALQLGELVSVSEKVAELKTYDTMGEWDDVVFEQELDKLTQVQFGDRYINAFQTFIEESNA